MAYPSNFMTITLNGTLAEGNEIWSAGFHAYSLSGDVDYATWATWVDTFGEQVANRLASMYSDTRCMTPADAPLLSVKFSYLDTAGLYLGDSIEYPVTAPGSNSGGYLPQGALVTTLESDKFKDPGKYNRFYLPIAPGASQTAWKLSTFNQEQYAANIAEALQDINDIFDDVTSQGNFVLAVMSASGTGFQWPVARVKIGAIYDTQRRRRNNLPEQYKTVELFPEVTP